MLEPKPADLRRMRFPQPIAPAQWSRQSQRRHPPLIPRRTHPAEAAANAQPAVPAHPAVSPGRRSGLPACCIPQRSSAGTPGKSPSVHEAPARGPSPGRTTSSLPPGSPSGPQGQTEKPSRCIRCSIPPDPSREPCLEAASRSQKAGMRSAPVRCTNSAEPGAGRSLRRATRALWSQASSIPYNRRSPGTHHQWPESTPPPQTKVTSCGCPRSRAFRDLGGGPTVPAVESGPRRKATSLRI